MAIKIFVIGVTGYIGGDAFYEIHNAHPEIEYTCLVRNSDKGAQVASQYPKVRLVYGDLDSVEILEEEAKKADIVMNLADCDHLVGVNALIKGISSQQRETPAFLIETSGTGILLYEDMQRKVLGEPSEKTYDDWEGISTMISFPDDAPHRHVDKVVIAADNGSMIRTVIVCPPTIYGPGRGPGNKRGHQIYELARATLTLKHGVQIGKGEAVWTEVHIWDLSNVYIKLVEAAISGGGKATWGTEGYYFTENGFFKWGDAAKWVATAAHKQGFLQQDYVKQISGEEADKLSQQGSVMWGANSRGKAIRARKILGWEPKERSLKDEVDDVVASEAKEMGLVKGHAEKILN
ncbi:MAG: hypothetical protein MMC33_003959 [Icmadophila ericetorum]|nr:hypothetical protein [Icmadophila ericetorum]